MSSELVVLTDPKEIEKAKDIAKSISIEDSNAVLQYAVGAQSKISTFADNMLEKVRSKDAGETGEILTNLLFKVKETDIDGFLSSKGGVVGKIFSFLNSAKRFMARYEKIENQIDNIVNELNKQRMTLLRDITTMDQMFKMNIEYLKELDLFIAAGSMKLEELRAGPLIELENKAKTTNDPIDVQRFNDFSQLLVRFERKVHDLKLSRMIAIQTGPQVRLIQNNDQSLVEKIQSAINETIPLWKRQVVIAIALFNSKKGASTLRAITDTTNDLLMKNSELLKTGTIEVAKETERGIVEIETLKKVNADLISTLEETIRIQEEGKAKRIQAEQDILQMENELKNKLTNMNSK